MGKLLRVLVVIMLLLSIGAVVLGSMLFMKRELFKGRTKKLENSIIRLGATIEAEAPAAGRRPDFPPRDLSDCTSEILDTPELSTFWDNYSNDLEEIDAPTLALNEKKRQLMNYYRRDPASGKIMKDLDTGMKMTSGEGTMQEVLDTLQTKAEAQYNRLNATREALRGVRSELVTTISELNSRKRELRVSLKEIEGLKAEIGRLNGEIRDLKERIGELEDENRGLQEQVAEARRVAAQLEEAKAELELQVEQLKKELADCKGPEGGPPRPEDQQPVGETVLSPGVKGEVIAVVEDLAFVVVKLNDTFMAEAYAEGQPGPVELMLHRKNEDGNEEFVTKVRIVQYRPEQKVGIANIMTDWQQSPVKVGDTVLR